MDTPQTAPLEGTEEALWSLWERCLNSVERINYCDRKSADGLVVETRNIYREWGGSEPDLDALFIGLLAHIHWDRPHHTARIFEAALERALQPLYFTAGILAGNGLVN
jgi:hypothetical protein